MLHENFSHSSLQSPLDYFGFIFGSFSYSGAEIVETTLSVIEKLRFVSFMWVPDSKRGSHKVSFAGINSKRGSFMHWENFLSLTLCSSITKTYIYQKYSPTQRNVAFCLHWNLFWLTMTSLAESFNTFLKYSIVQKRTKREIIIPMETTLSLSPFFICMFC